LLNKELHWKKDEERKEVETDPQLKNYYTKSKMQIDFSDVFAYEDENMRKAKRITKINAKVGMYENKNKARDEVRLVTV
jgi:hypothetical protein